jgi:hypothetical protein
LISTAEGRIAKDYSSHREVLASESMTEEVMKSSIHLMPALFLLALLGFFALAYLSPVGQVMAEGGSQGFNATYQTETAQSQQCEDREVEADEGYGVSHKEIRRVCH